MKKLSFLFICLFVAMVAFAENNDQNVVKMVTYFPVPYVTYNDLNVFGRCDVGGYKQCNLSTNGVVRVSDDSTLFPDAHHDKDFRSGHVSFQGKKLSLNAATSAGSLYANQIKVGWRNDGPANLIFQKNLRLVRFIPTAMDAKADNNANVKLLYLADKLFPDCPEKNIYWRQLIIDGSKGVFLVCGS